jgi:protein involved in polysaccharide export with SLBB domain
MLAASVAVIPAACQSGPAAMEQSAEAATFQASEYRLDVGDKVRLIVFGQDNLGGEFGVSDSGVLSLPLIGEVPARGHTIGETRNAITAALAAGYLKDPRVSLEVINFRPFYVLGEVNKPGEFPYQLGITVLNAAAQAGGYTYRADTRRVYIRHAKGTGETVYNLTPQITVAPGDTIRIGERHF